MYPHPPKRTIRVIKPESIVFRLVIASATLSGRQRAQSDIKRSIFTCYGWVDAGKRPSGFKERYAPMGLGPKEGSELSRRQIDYCCRAKRLSRSWGDFGHLVAN